MLVCAFALILLASAAALIFGGTSGREKYAVITVAGQETARINLDAVVEAYEYQISPGCTALVEHGQISMCRADCPDKLCVARGVLSDGFAPIICLPNKVVIRIEKDAVSEYDAVS